MPHLIIEHSANLGTRIDIEELVDGMHETALSIDGLPIGGLRTRAQAREHYRIADRHPENAFVHVILKLGHGRPLEKRREFGEALFTALCDLLEPVSSTSPLAISFEVQEIHPQLTWKKNNLRDYIAEREV
jgi:5-carboxymethyl-2-hydroxymuconate isomerase